MLSAADQALVTLLAVEQGGVAPLRAVAATNDPFPQLFADKLVTPGPGGRFVLTAAGRQRATEARDRAKAGTRVGSVSGCSLKAVP